MKIPSIGNKASVEKINNIHLRIGKSPSHNHGKLSIEPAKKIVARMI